MDSQYTIGSESAHHFSEIWCYSLLQIRQQEKDIKEKTKWQQETTFTKTHGQYFCDRDCNVSTVKELLRCMWTIVFLFTTIRVCYIKDSERGYKNQDVQKSANDKWV